MAHPGTLSVFALDPSTGLGQAIADELGIELAPYEAREFEDGESKVRPLQCVRGADVFVVGSLHGDARASVNDRLCRLLFFVSTLRDAGARRVTVVAPYLCYARKDRRTNPRDPVTTRYVAALLEAAGTARVVTVDVHNLAAYQNAFRIPSEHVEASPLFVERCRTLGRELTVVAPDPGGFHRAEALRDRLARPGGEAPALAMLGKHRHAGVVRSEAFVGDVDGRIAVIVDDMIVSGTTLIRAAEACLARGAVEVHALATHAVFSASAGATLAAPALDSIVVTDTIAPDRLGLGPAHDKLIVLPIAPLLARTIRALHHDRSLTDVMEAALTPEAGLAPGSQPRAPASADAGRRAHPRDAGGRARRGPGHGRAGRDR